ncbi:Cof-type HAD-IIB family hydrolase [Geobacillus zalihae]|uniref:Cof-type HAD-IIB family hydrolase n=1 Tax=Geobacillus zalihae TaxID=213419 RepID=A0A1V9CTA3_9BACL|nr:MULTISPECIES: Cof-type HAD-IIB family hydrolase [Geobacillus]AGE21533.1 putative cof-like hydrolase [Geobacillus sp. GHH01]EPR26551.1 Hydrolase (HAD superfamily) [Geobacillus sp. WSUCF1]OQP16925.1 phosphatase [Geobacillus zalihae]OQP24786.1 phosphatase [Geobacillus zalihae]QNU18299.1 Cof-type HAD-IIB family hydrolase [Geobacillus zalihae]
MNVGRKIVFFDIDGTLLDEQKQLPLSTIEAVRRLKQSGVYVAIATGRAPFMFEHVRKQLGIDSFVSFNGQYVVFEGNVLYKQPLRREKIRALTEEAHKNGHPLVFMDAEKMRASISDHPHIHVSMASLKFAHPPVDPLYYENKDIYQALLFCRAEEEEPYVRNYPEFRFVRWHDVSTDVLPAGGSKAEGIRMMIEKLGIDKKDVYAFGDGLNDIEMLSFVGTGVAMGNAHEEVKRVADFVTKPVDKEGIWYGLKQLQLIR